MTGHEADYRAYGDLIRGLTAGDRAHLDDVVRHPKQAAQLRRLGLISPGDAARASALAPGWQEAKRVDADSMPFADVYQAGLWLHLTEDQYFRRAKPYKLYRGQRDVTWPTSASLFRNENSNPPPERRRERLISLAARLRDRMDCSEDEAFAAAQHYGGEANIVGGPGPVTTWLLDVTWNPFIALAFATHDGIEGDIGVVAAIDVSEWERKLGPIAAIRVVELDLLRPQQQEAAFIDSAVPELADDYLPLSFRFRQHAGLTFEDASVHATTQAIYPRDDPIIPIVQEWAREEVAQDLPPSSAGLQLPAHVRMRRHGRPAGFVPAEVFRGAIECSLAQLTDPPDASNEPLRTHIDLLGVFHSQARYHKLHPGLGALADGAWVAYERASHGQPSSLYAMTRQYNFVYDDRFRLIVHRVEELHRQGGPSWEATHDEPILIPSGGDSDE
jgi:hypothetical protein